MATWVRAVRKRNPGPREDELVTDPRGFSVLISARRWRKHILKRHGNLEPFYPELVATIGHPDFITQSLEDASRNLYYGAVRKPPLPGWRYIAAIVELDYEESTGSLVTAYFEADRPEGERIIWTP
jgi:hypothetical protein